jgi:hypothetical protein
MAYIGKAPASGIRNRFIFTATAGQTTFSGADDESRTLSYTDGHFTDVYLNGVKLDKSDYTATSGTSVVLDEGAAVDDILEVVAYDTFSVFNGEFSADVTVGGTLDANGNVDVAGDLKVDTIKHTNGTTAITIDSDGAIVKEAGYIADVGLTTANSQDTSNPFTITADPIKFDLIRTNKNNMYTSSNGRFTAPIDGLYRMSYSLLADDFYTGDFGIIVQKNGSDLSDRGRSYGQVANEYRQHSSTFTIELDANDYLSIRMSVGQLYIDSDGAYTNVVFELIGT